MSDELGTTPLTDRHVAAGAKLGPFAVRGHPTGARVVRPSSGDRDHNG